MNTQFQACTLAYMCMQTSYRNTRMHVLKINTAKALLNNLHGRSGL